MADLYDSDLGGNTRKVTPSSLFGTREIKWLQLDFDYPVYTDGDAPDGYKNSDSLYWAAIKCIQEAAEIVYLGAPTRIAENRFVFGIAADTAEWRYGEVGYYDPEDYREGNNDRGIIDIIDRLQNTFGDPYWWALTELEDCGFGLMPGNILADPGSF